MLMFRASARVKLGVAAAPRVSRVFFFFAACGRMPAARVSHAPAPSSPPHAPQPPRTPPPTTTHLHRRQQPRHLVQHFVLRRALRRAVEAVEQQRRPGGRVGGGAGALVDEGVEQAHWYGGRAWVEGGAGAREKTARNAGQPGGRPCGIYGARGRCRAVAAFVELVESGPWRKGGERGGWPAPSGGGVTPEAGRERVGHLAFFLAHPPCLPRPET